MSASAASDPDGAGADLHAIAGRIVDNVSAVLVGKDDTVRVALVTLLAGGHLLIEDVPGVGKTSLAKALARSIDCTVSRIQFTPDLVPSDITGAPVYNRNTAEFEFRPGPVFAHVVVGDEINRASPKTQSALLECMEEHQVTVDGRSYGLASPFMVVATQNPAEMAGTYALPEAQRDRFTARISVGYPDTDAELAMIGEHSGNDPLAELAAVCTAEQVRGLIDAARQVHVAAQLRQYAVKLISATRQARELALGASPRATLQLVRAARAQALLAGREFVVPDDVHAVAVPVLAHRLVLAPEQHAAGVGVDEVVRTLLRRIPVPHGSGRAGWPRRGPAH